MVYTAPGQNFLKNSLGTDSSVIAAELGKIDAAIDSSSIKVMDLTASMVSSVSLAANGADIASGSNATFYCVFVAPVALTLVGMVTYMTEAYVKETTDAKVELKTEAASPVTKFTYTLPTAGRALKSMITTAPSSAAMAAGDALDLVITATGSSTGTGHVKVFLVYMIN
jgi:hypothetical protein